MDKVIPVDSYVPGCAPKPEAIIDGIVLALEKLAEKGKRVDQGIFERLAGTREAITAR